MLVDETLLDQCMIVEDRLVDDYVLGHLTQEERNLFEKKFYDSGRVKQKIQSAQTLAQYAKLQPVPQPSSQSTPQQESSREPKPGLFAFWKFATWAPATAFATIIIAALFGIWAAQARHQAAQLQAQLDAEKQQTAKLQNTLQQQNQKQSQTAEELDRERSLSAELQEQLVKINAASQSIVTLALLPEFRSEGTHVPNATIAPDTTLLQLEAAIEPDVNYQQYGITLQRGSGELVLTKSNLQLKPQKRADKEVLILLLPSRSLAAGDYTLILQGRNGSDDYTLVGGYSFHITKK